MDGSFNLRDKTADRGQALPQEGSSSSVTAAGSPGPHGKSRPRRRPGAWEAQGRSPAWGLPFCGVWPPRGSVLLEITSENYYTRHSFGVQLESCFHET